MKINRRRKLGMSLLPVLALSAVLAAMLVVFATYKTSASQEDLAQRKMAATSAVNMAAAELRATGALEPSKQVTVEGVKVQLTSAVSADGNTVKISADGQGEVIQATAVREVVAAPAPAPVLVSTAGNAPSAGYAYNSGNASSSGNAGSAYAAPQAQMGMAGAAPTFNLVPAAFANKEAAVRGEGTPSGAATDSGQKLAQAPAGMACAPQTPDKSVVYTSGYAGNTGNSPALGAAGAAPQPSPTLGGWTVYNADNVVISKDSVNREAIVQAEAAKAEVARVDAANIATAGNSGNASNSGNGYIVSTAGNAPSAGYAYNSGNASSAGNAPNVATDSFLSAVPSPTATASNVELLAALASRIKSGGLNLPGVIGTKLGPAGMLGNQ